MWELKAEIQQLVAETDDYTDALQYLDDVVLDVGCTREEALAELRKAYGFNEEEQ